MTSDYSESIHHILFEMVKKVEVVGMHIMRLGATLAVICYNDGFADVEGIFEIL